MHDGELTERIIATATACTKRTSMVTTDPIAVGHVSGRLSFDRAMHEIFIFTVRAQLTGRAGKIDHVRTSDSSKTLTVPSKEKLNTRSMSLQTQPSSQHTTVGGRQQVVNSS